MAFMRLRGILNKSSIVVLSASTLRVIAATKIHLLESGGAD
jgi:hypothetical protein